jgi:ligand-binding sensor domain-containing protein
MKKFCTKINLIFILIFLSFDISGQNYTVKTFTTENGLAHNNITSIARDSTGFLWIGTWDGISRYDGYVFKNYYHIPGDSTALPYFSIVTLGVDKSNNLWILTENSDLVLYDRVNDNFKKINIGNNRLLFAQRISIDNNGDLWVKTKNEFLKRDNNSGEFIKYEIINGLGKPFPVDSIYVSSIDFSGNKTYWYSGSRIQEFEIKASEKESCKLILKNIYTLESTFFQKGLDFDSNWWFSFYESPTGNEWIFSNIGLFKLDKQKNIFREHSGKIETGELKGRNRFIWSDVNEGLYCYDPSKQTAYNIKSIANQLVNTVFIDEKDIIWLSIRSATGAPLGLKEIVFTNSFFRNYFIEREGDQFSAVFSIVKDNINNIWVGVRGKDHIIQYTPDNKIKETGKLSQEMYRLSGHIRSMITTKDGIWIGYFTNLLRFYDFKTGQFKRFLADERTFRTIAVNKNGNLFIGNYNLSLYNPGTGKTEILWKSPMNFIIYKTLVNDTGIIWCGMSTKFMLRYNSNTRESSVYSFSSNDYHIQDICSGDKNDLWLATLGTGIINFNPASGKTVYYTTSSGLSNNTTYNILKDKSGNLWISTNNGISRLNPKTGLIRIFNNNDGLMISEFNANASYIAEDGEFFFGGMGGFVGFYPDSLAKIEKEDVRQRILLTDFKVSGEKKVLPKPLNNSDTIILKKGENNFQLYFSSTDFTNSEKTMFRYRLEGVSKSWTETDSRNRDINYANLKPGKYLLRIQATNRDGEWSTDKKIVFLTTPYFYQTLFFKISVPGFVLSLVIGFIFLYIRQIKQRERQKQDTLRLQSLRGQMNPHFIFNSLNSINYFISNNDKLSANRYIADFSRLIRSILSNLGNDYVPFEDELNSIKDYLNIEHLRFGDKFNYEINTDQIQASYIEVFPGLVQPFIENAIWHGVRALEKRKGIIKVQFAFSGTDMIRCIIEDNGIGRNASQERRTDNGNHKSRGIGIVIERLQLISKLRGTKFNIEITDLYSDKKETGTRVEIDIPVKLI